MLYTYVGLILTKQGLGGWGDSSQWLGRLLAVVGATPRSGWGDSSQWLGWLLAVVGVTPRSGWGDSSQWLGWLLAVVGVTPRSGWGDSSQWLGWLLAFFWGDASHFFWGDALHFLGWRLAFFGMTPRIFWGDASHFSGSCLAFWCLSSLVGGGILIFFCKGVYRNESFPMLFQLKKTEKKFLIFFSRFAPFRPSPPLKKPVHHRSPVTILYRKSGKNRISDADRQKRISDS